MTRIQCRWSSPSVVEPVNIDKRCVRAVVDGVYNSHCYSSQVTEPKSGSHMSSGADTTPSTYNTSAHFSHLKLSEVLSLSTFPPASRRQSCPASAGLSRAKAQPDDENSTSYQAPFIVSSQRPDIDNTMLPFSGMSPRSQHFAQLGMACQINNREVDANSSVSDDNTSGGVSFDFTDAYQEGTHQVAHQGNQPPLYSGGSAYPGAHSRLSSIGNRVRMANVSSYIANAVGPVASQDVDSANETDTAYYNLGERSCFSRGSMSNAFPGHSTGPSTTVNGPAQVYNPQMFPDNLARMNYMTHGTPQASIHQGFSQPSAEHDPFKGYNTQPFPGNPAEFVGMRNPVTQGSNFQAPSGNQNVPVTGASISWNTGNYQDIGLADIDFMASAEAVIADGSRYSLPPKFGVLKITNIPYSVTKEEVICLTGRQARILPFELGYPVHIIMERSTAKTMDCFVEFVTPEDAKHTVEYINEGLPGYPPRLGGRNVVVEMSSQDELLHAMFPRAKCVAWCNGIPLVLENKDPYSTGFQGFFTQEEIFNVIRHAEFPRRAPFADKCPQRIFESTISTLYKFPWYATSLYTIEDRNALYRACRRQLVALDSILRKKDTVGLDERLLNDLLVAGLRCPVFNERQKCSLFIAAQSEGIKDMPKSSKAWPFDSLIRKAGAAEEEVQQFAQVMAHASTKVKAGSKMLPNKWSPAEHSSSGMMFGQVWFEWSYGNTNHKFSFVVEHEIQILKGLVKDFTNPTTKTPTKAKKKKKGRKA